MPSSSLTASCGHWAWYAKYSLPVLTIRILVPPSTMNSFMPLRGTSSSRHTRLHMRTNLPWLVAAPIPASAPALEDRNDDFPERHHNPPSPLPPVPPSVGPPPRPEDMIRGRRREHSFARLIAVGHRESGYWVTMSSTAPEGRRESTPPRTLRTPASGISSPGEGGGLAGAIGPRDPPGQPVEERPGPVGLPTLAQLGAATCGLLLLLRLLLLLPHALALGHDLTPSRTSGFAPC